MKVLLCAILFLLAINSFAQSNCKYVDGSAKVQWTGYKTRKKIPVRGLLKKVTISPSKGNTVQEIIKGSTFEVSGGKDSVDSKNRARDAKIARFFFGNFKGGPIIKGNVTEITHNKITTRMTFNGRTRTIGLRYTFTNGLLRARGGIDFVSLFGATKSHTELGKACAAKHEGVTGTDARIELTAKFTGC